MITFVQVDPSDVPWHDLDRAPGRSVGQTRPWLDFLVEARGIEPVTARVERDGAPVGWFAGGLVSRGPVRALGSPMRGWATSAMGCTLDPGTDAADVIAALPDLAFGALGCRHLEVADRAMANRAAIPRGFRADAIEGTEVDLERDDDALLASFTANGRRDVRRALRNGVVVEHVDPIADPQVIDEYIEQVTEAFAKRGVRPTVDRALVAAFVRHLHPAGDLVVLRARTPDGAPAATGFFPGLAGGSAEFWMGGSHRAHQHLLPNEALMWSAMTAWRERGARSLLLGGGAYKAKYGGAPHRQPLLRRSRPAALETARAGVLALDRRRRRLTR